MKQEEHVDEEVLNLIKQIEESSLEMREKALTLMRRIRLLLEHKSPSDPEYMALYRAMGHQGWLSLSGIAPNLLHGEDAQEWVSRMRREETIEPVPNPEEKDEAIQD